MCVFRCVCVFSLYLRASMWPVACGHSTFRYMATHLTCTLIPLSFLYATRIQASNKADDNATKGKLRDVSP